MPERLTVHQRNYFKEVRAAQARSLETAFDWQLLSHGITGVLSNYEFHPDRNWSVDRAIPSLKVCAEIQGGVRGKPVFCHACHQMVKQCVKGRWIPVCTGIGHSSATKIQTDIEKANALQEAGWLCAYISSAMIEDGSGILIFKRFLEVRKSLAPFE